MILSRLFFIFLMFISSYAYGQFGGLNLETGVSVYQAKAMFQELFLKTNAADDFRYFKIDIRNSYNGVAGMDSYNKTLILSKKHLNEYSTNVWYFILGHEIGHYMYYKNTGKGGGYGKHCDTKDRVRERDADAVVSQIGKGYKYTALKPVYTLCILNDTFHENPKECYHHYTFVNSEDLKDRIEGMNLTYIELPKFHPRSFSEKKMAVLWLRFLTEIKDRDGHIQQIPEDLVKNRYTGKALEILEESSFSKVELEAYDKYWDSISIEKDGLEGALEKGKVEGREKKEIEAVLGFYKNGISIDIISKSLNISEKRVQEIIKLNKFDNS